MHFLKGWDENDAPVSCDTSQCPRIEVREGNGAVVFVGVPSTLGGNYFAVPDSIIHIVDGKPTGRSCFDCVPQGMSKAIVTKHLLSTGEVVAGQSLAIGDQPAGNDEGLTRWHTAAAKGEAAIPFVSVSERDRVVPDFLSSCHVTRISNADASGKVLDALADQLQQVAGADGVLQMSVEAASALVCQVNKDPETTPTVPATPAA